VLVAALLIERYCGLDERLRLGPGGKIVVPDGDTLRMGDTEYRLYGIDAPELHQSCTADGKDWACGRAARDRLKALASGHEVACETRASDRFGRSVAVCGTEQVPDFGAALVREGLAVALGFARDSYGDAEAAAETAKRGIWRGTFERPSDWRQAHPRKD
jgi:endonuclease YncB( thermonuclease family)